MTRKELLREVTVHRAEGVLRARVLLNTWKLGSQPAFHLLFFPPGASCPRGGWRVVMGDFLTQQINLSVVGETVLPGQTDQADGQ